MIKFPETALICGTALIVSGHAFLGNSLVTLSIITTFIKWSLSQHEARQTKEAYGTFLAGISGTINEFLTSRGIMYAPHSQDDGSLH